MSGQKCLLLTSCDVKRSSVMESKYSISEKNKNFFPVV